MFAKSNVSRFMRRSRREELRRAAAAAELKEQERLAMSTKLRSLMREKRRSVKYANVFEEQSGPFGDDLVLWPFHAPGFQTRREFLRSRSEARGVKKLACPGIVEQTGFVQKCKTLVNGAYAVYNGANSPATLETMQVASDAIKQVADTAEAVTDCFTTITKVFKDMYDSFMKYVPPALGGALLIAFVFWIGGSQRVPSILWTAMTLIMARLLGAEAWSAIKEFMNKPPEIVEQSPFTGGLAAAICAYLMRHSLSHFFHCSIGSYFSTTLLKQIGDAPRAFSSLKGILDWTVKAVETVLNKIGEYFNLPHIRLSQKYGEEIDRLVLEVASAIKYEMSTEPKKDSAEVRLARIMNLHSTCWSFKNVYRGNREVTHELEVLTQQLTRWAIPLRAAVGGSCGYTQLPVSVCLYGEPGVGKTMMVQNLCMAVLKQAEYISENLSEDEATKLIYTKPFNSEYLDGYYEQPIFLIDDFMAKKATPSDQSNAAFDLMTYYSAFNMVVNKAVCEDKGMWSFASKIIMMTTNLRHLDEVNLGQCLLSPLALQRRVDIHYEVCVRPQFRKPNSSELDWHKFKLEWNKCIKEGATAISAYPWHVWEVFPTSWNGSHDKPIPGSGMKFEVILLEMVKLLVQRRDSHKGSLDAAKRILAAPRATMEELMAAAGVTEQAGEIEPEEEDPDEILSRMGPRMSPPSYAEAMANGFDLTADVDDYVCLSDTSEGEETVFDDCDPVFKMSRFTVLRRKIKSFFARAMDILEAFFAQISLVKVAIAALVAGGAIALYHLVKGVWKTVRSMFYTEDIVEQSNRPKSSSITFGKLRQQSGPISEGNHRLVYNNSFKLSVVTAKGNHHVLGQATYLEMDYLVMPKHFDTRLEDALQKGSITRDSEMSMRSCRSAEQVIKLKVGHFLDFPRSNSDFRDLCFVRTTNLHTAKKITGFVVSEKDMRDVGGLPVRLDTARIEEDDKLVPFNDRIIFMSKAVETGTHGVTIGRTRHTNWLSYSANTIDGDCGAPLCLQSAQRFQHRVWLGLHVGFKQGFGQAYATQLTAELCKTHLDDLKKFTKDPRCSEATFDETVEQAGLCVPEGFTVVDSEEMPFKGVTENPDDMLGFGSFSGLGELTRVVSAPVRTNLATTFVYEDDMLEDVMPEFALRPMRLAPYLVDEDMVYPTVNALEPYAGAVISIDMKLVRMAVPLAMRPFSQSTSFVSGRIWSVQEALVGANGAKGIPLGTSVGLPGCVQHRNKRAMLGGAMEFDFDKEEVKSFMVEVEGVEAMCKKGIRPFFMARGFLKDELRKPGKQARYIAGTNVHYYVLCRMYFGQIVSTQMNQFKESGMCPGINPYQDWEWLQNFVTKKGDKVWDGDFSGFDTSQQPQMLGECLNYINFWYTTRGASEEENAVRTVLFQDLMKSRHAVGRGVVATHVVQWQRSLPSGHFLTTFINSMLSMVCIVSAFVRSTGRYDFWDVASAATLGDDNLVGVSDEVVDEFNQISVARVLKDEFNMVYTAGRKGEELKPYLDISEVTFLQRMFRLKDNVVVGPIRKESIFGALLYTKKGDVKYRTEVMCQNIEGALSELSLWPEEEWSRSIGAIMKVAVRLKYTPRFMVDTSQSYFEFTCERTDTGWF
jgi:hypothetical protein